jgi:hypothetical protein
MGDIFEDCHECNRECINNQFCGRDSNISLPKHLKIKIIANPAFWGFDDGAGNILTEGTATFGNGYYDFFDGYDEMHFATKQCGVSGPIEGPYRDEQRPDVLYRSVYDPDDPSADEFSGLKHYNGSTRDDIERGGAEVYLVDRAGTATSDLESCDTSNPASVYKIFPENFGFGTKISTTDTVFKNKTGAWRYVSQDMCYDNLYTESRLVSECDGSPKQHVMRDDHFGAEYDPYQIRVSGESGCIHDGGVPEPYKGTVRSIYRNSGIEDFISIELQYNSGPASGIVNGMTIGVDGDYLSGAYTLFNVAHSSGATSCKIVSTLGSGEIRESGAHYWAALGTFDPDTCCGGAAHNISNETKKFNSVKNYHADFGRIFNNNKNKLQSNRFNGNRYTYGLDATTQLNPPNSFRKNTTIPDIDLSGVVFNSGYPAFSQEYPYYGAFFDIDKYDTSIRNEGKSNKTQGNNGTCYSKKATLSVYPDCMTQFNQYDECETETTRYLTNQVSRLAVVYRGCDYEDACTFNDSGNPYFAPTGMNDLRRGLAGQEVCMYVNLSTVWGAEIKRDPCGCGEEPPPGNQPPEMIEIPSPVTFPSFPKFDLYPSGYGAQDIGWQSQYFECEDACWSGECQGFPTLEHWGDLRQPYTTYGFIRNLCGAVSSDRRLVIKDAFSSLIQQGNYRNTTPPTGNNPMYWEFTSDVAYESGQTGGLSGIGNYPFWGLSDAGGRLVAPYFRTKTSIATTLCPPTSEIPYLSYDRCSTWNNGWPTDSVPFLIEIDHSDECVGCASVIMEPNNHVISLQSLDTTFLHGPDGSDKYGYSNCRYRGIGYDPTYSCQNGFDQACPSGIDSSGDNTIIHNEPYIGQTCPKLSGDYVLGPINIEGTQIPIGWRSNPTGANSLIKLADGDSNGDLLTYFPSEFEIYGSFKLACEGNHNFLKEYRVNDYNINAQEMALGGRCRTLPNALDSLYNGGNSCNKVYPSADSNLKLQSRFVLLASGIYESFLKYMPEYALEGTSSPHNSFGGTFDRISEYAPENGRRLWQIVEDLVAENAMGCPSYMLMYGCWTESPSVSGFYPCQGCNRTTAPCDCAGVDCDGCGVISSVDDVPDRRLPLEWNTNCGCDCNLKLMKIVRVNGRSNQTVTYNADTRLCNAYYESYYCNGVSPCGFVVAIQASGELGVTPLVYADTDNTWGRRINVARSPFVYGAVSSACSWHSGPNAQVSGINYDLQIPDVLTRGSTHCPTLIPSECQGSDCEDSNVGYGTCLDPISWSGEAPINGVTLTRRSCYPETVLVNKIECLGEGFKLYIDREYHSHDRTWQEIKMVGIPPAPICFPVQKGAYRYVAGTGEQTCVAIPFATPSDSVTPVYHTDPVVGPTGEILSYRGVCSTHPSIGSFVTQDFRYGPYPIASGEDTLWNYFNLFYEEGYPSSKYHAAIYLGNPDPEADPPDPENPCASGTIVADYSIFSDSEYETPANRDGVDWTNKKHSCIQDSAHCGGEFFCNKMFFPRRSYKTSTRVSRFGALSLCKQNSTSRNPSWYFGYESFSKLGAENDLLKETENSRFIDVCDNSNITTTLAPVGIDDDYIIVEDYLPLIGIPPNLFRYTSDVKSCIIVETGCTSSWLPTHSDNSISAGAHSYKTFYTDNKTSFGYYLDNVSSSGSDNCLFNQFKAYIDVECCTSNIKTIYDASGADPTNLEYVIEGVPSWACNGFVHDPACGCEDSTCGATSLSAYPNDLGGAFNPHSHNNSQDVPTTEVVCMTLWLAYEWEWLPIAMTFIPRCKPLLCVGGTTPTFVPLPGSPTTTYPVYYGHHGPAYGPISKPAWGYKCGDTIYMQQGLFDDICNFNPFVANSGLDPSSECCPNLQGLCGLLNNAAAISSTAGCYDYNGLVYSNYSSIWRTCGCKPKKSLYTTCDSAVIKAIITEE